MLPVEMKLRLGDVTVDRGRRVVCRGAEAVHLSPRAYRLLELLLDRRPAAVSREEILETLWPNAAVSDGSIAVLVNEIRRMLGDDARAPRWLRTLPAKGYVLDGDVLEEEGPASLRAHGVVWAGSVIALAEGENVLGRDLGAAVVIGHPAVSRHHARIVVDGAVAFLEDLGSHNGTFLGARRVEGRVPLRDGDQLVLGAATLTYRSPAAAGSDDTITAR